MSEAMPTWLIISAGFDAHRFDPITELGLTSGDYIALTKRALEWAPKGRRIVMLEGGYDLDALAWCAAGVVGVLSGDDPEPVDMSEAETSGGPGGRQLDAISSRQRVNDLIEDHVDDAFHIAMIKMRICSRNFLYEFRFDHVSLPSNSDHFSLFFRRMPN